MMHLCIFIGCFLVAILCWTDFRNKVYATRNYLYYILLVFFVLFNVTFYIVICGLLIQQKPDDLILNRNAIEYTATDFFTVFLASLMYFGFGSASFPNPLSKDQEINIYQTTFRIFEQLLPKPSTDVLDQKVQEYIEKPDRSLINIAETLRDRGNGRNWNLLEEKWEKIDAELIIKELDYLSSLEQESKNNVGNLRPMIRLEKERLLKALGTKIKDYIRDFFIINGKTQQDREIIYQIIGLPPKSRTSLLSDKLAFTLVVSFCFGFFAFGPVLAFGQSTDVLSFSLFGAISLSIFGVLLLKASQSTNLKDTLIRGISSGLFGSLTWTFLTKILWGYLTQTLQNTTDVNNVLNKIVQTVIAGVMIGILVSFSMYLSKQTWIAEKLLTSTFRKYVFFSFATGLSFLLVKLMIHHYQILNDGFLGYFRTLILGIGCGLVIAVSTKLFESQETTS